MARADRRDLESVRREIEAERERLSRAVDSLRDAVKIRTPAPILAAVALGAGFTFGGGIGATARLLLRRIR